MRLVDEKWRLFGIVNIFDLLVLCAITSLIFLTFKWATIAEDPSFIKSETVHMKCKGFATVPDCISSLAVPDYIASLIKEGDVMLDENGNVICKIEKVLSVVPGAQMVYQSKDGEKIFSNSDRVKMALQFDLTAYKRKDGIFFENLGCNVTNIRQITMKSKKYTVILVITEMSDAS